MGVLRNIIMNCDIGKCFLANIALYALMWSKEGREFSRLREFIAWKNV